MLLRRVCRPVASLNAVVTTTALAPRPQLTSSTHDMALSSSSVAVCHQQQYRHIRIQDPNPDIKSYWRKDTENIRAQNKGVPLGSSDVESEAFAEYVKLATANGKEVDSFKLAKWTFGVLMLAFGIPYMLADEIEQQECSAPYTSYEKPPPLSPEEEAEKARLRAEKEAAAPKKELIPLKGVRGW